MATSDETMTMLISDCLVKPQDEKGGVQQRPEEHRSKLGLWNEERAGYHDSCISSSESSDGFDEDESVDSDEDESVDNDEDESMDSDEDESVDSDEDESVDSDEDDSADSDEDGERGWSTYGDSDGFVVSDDEEERGRSRLRDDDSLMESDDSGDSGWMNYEDSDSTSENDEEDLKYQSSAADFCDGDHDTEDEIDELNTKDEALEMSEEEETRGADSSSEQDKGQKQNGHDVGVY